MAAKAIQKDPKDQYSQTRQKFEGFCQAIKGIIEESLKADGLRPHSMAHRAKTVESFGEKCEKRNQDGTPKYPKPFDQITDLAGVRVILYTLSDVERVRDFVRLHFEAQEDRDLGAERYSQGKFGYQSLHLLVRLKAPMDTLPQYKQYKGMICEIQVRTILQHAWAEIEHDIRYKTSKSIPTSIERKFTALAGLLEIGDREFQSIQDIDSSLKKEIQEELNDELTRASFVSINSTAETEKVTLAAKTARGLLADKKFDGAIAQFDRKIEDQPKSFTLYLGRAKAKFLAGDSIAAMEDVEIASNLQPGSPFVKSLRNRIAHGNVDEVSAPENDLDKANNASSKANEALSKGNGEQAYEYYSEALSLGANRSFNTFNRSMACVIARDYSGAVIQLGQLRRHTGTPMEINIQALATLLLGLTDNEKFEVSLKELRGLLEVKKDFQFELSPLRFLRMGMEQTKWSKSEIKITEQVFSTFESVLA